MRLHGGTHADARGKLIMNSLYGKTKLRRLPKWRWVRHCLTRHTFTQTIGHRHNVSVCTHGYYYEYPVQ